MQTTSPTPRQRVRRIRTGYNLITAAQWFGTALPLPLVVLYAQSRGFDLFQVGLYTGLYAITVAAMEIPSGVLADILGRKRVALVAYGLSLVATVTLLFAFSMPVLLVYAVTYGVARALSSGTLEAWFVDALQEADPQVELQPALAVAGSFELGGLAAGTLLGGFLPVIFRGLPDHPTALLTPLSVPLVASAVVTALVIVAVTVVIRESRQEAQTAGLRGQGPSSTQTTGTTATIGGTSITLRAFGAVVLDALHLSRGNPLLLRLFAAAALSGVALIGVETFWQPYFVEHVGLGQDGTGLLGMIFAGCFAAGMVGKVASVALTRIMGHRHARVAALFQAAQFVSLLLLSRLDTVFLAVACFWLIYFSLAGTGPSVATLFHGQVPSHRRAVMLSLHSMATFVGASVGSLLLGWVVRSTSIPLAWTLAAGLLACSLWLLLRIDRRAI